MTKPLRATTANSELRNVAIKAMNHLKPHMIDLIKQTKASPFPDGSPLDRIWIGNYLAKFPRIFVSAE